jgi:hypothetical protein
VTFLSVIYKRVPHNAQYGKSACPRQRLRSQGLTPPRPDGFQTRFRDSQAVDPTRCGEPSGKGSFAGQTAEAAHCLSKPPTALAALSLPHATEESALGGLRT